MGHFKVCRSVAFHTLTGCATATAVDFQDVCITPAGEPCSQQSLPLPLPLSASGFPPTCFFSFPDLGTDGIIPPTSTETRMFSRPSWVLFPTCPLHGHAAFSGGSPPSVNLDSCCLHERRPPESQTVTGVADSSCSGNTSPPWELATLTRPACALASSHCSSRHRWGTGASDKGLLAVTLKLDSHLPGVPNSRKGTSWFPL